MEDVNEPVLHLGKRLSTIDLVQVFPVLRFPLHPLLSRHHVHGRQVEGENLGMEILKDGVKATARPILQFRVDFQVLVSFFLAPSAMVKVFENVGWIAFAVQQGGDENFLLVGFERNADQPEA